MLDKAVSNSVGNSSDNVVSINVAKYLFKFSINCSFVVVS